LFRLHHRHLSAEGTDHTVMGNKLNRQPERGAPPARRRPRRLFRRFFGGLLVLGAGVAGVHFAMGADSPLAPFTETASLVWNSDDLSLEDVADYWLDPQMAGMEGGAKGRATALALAIRLGRLEALRGGTQPVPDKLKRRLKGHFPDEILDEARWTVARPDSRIGRILARWPVEEGAVTLGNVIVFKTQKASRDPELFAHELAHVEQYHELGTGEFAQRYAADPRPIEAEARAKARRIARSSWLR
jgi:hypothetical protein